MLDIVYSYQKLQVGSGLNHTYVSLLELFVVFSKLLVVSPSDNRINFAAHDRCFTMAMNSGSIAYKPAMIGSGSSR